MTHGSLFSGIGGFDLGFERAGFETVWQVEIDEYCRRVLERHFPRAERFSDIRECGAHNLKPVDVISGGFPCQDISVAGKRAGIDGSRSGLWSEMRRIVRELRPRFVVVENVSALLNRGIERVLGDLAESGFDAEWDVLPACAAGAPHIRERFFLVAYDSRYGCGSRRTGRSDPSSSRKSQQTLLDNSMRGRYRAPEDEVQARRNGAERANWWSIEPNVGRVAHGVPRRVDRLRGLGNAVVPQIAQWIAERIKAITA